MKTFTVIGSDISKKCIQRLSQEDCVLRNSYVSVNPISFLQENLGTDKLKLERFNEESYIEDVNKSIFANLQSNKTDFLVIDLLDCRLTVNTYETENDSFVATANNGIKKALIDVKCNITDTIDSFSLSENEWYELLSQYVAQIKKVFTPESVIVIDARSANTYLSKNNKVYNLFSEEFISKINKFFDNLYVLLRLIAPDFIYIPSLDFYYSDEKDGKVFSYRLQSEFYEYTSNAIDMYISGKSIEEIAILRDKYKKLSIERYSRADSRTKNWKNVSLTGFKGIYSDDFGNVINTGNTIIDITLNGSNNIIHLASGCVCDGFKIIVGSNNNIKIENGVLIKKTVFNLLENSKVYIGGNSSFDDSTVVIKKNSEFIFGNQSKLLRNSVIGIDCDCCVKIGNKNEIWRLDLHAFDKSLCKIGNNIFINSDCIFTAHNYTKIEVNDNCLIAGEVNIISGDGHSIFDINTGKKVNDMSLGNNTVSVGEHVWLCRKAMLLSGTVIKTGSVVGAGAICTKPFKTNNVLIAGVPASIKKRNICWSRNNASNDISICEPYKKLSDDEE